MIYCLDGLMVDGVKRQPMGSLPPFPWICSPVMWYRHIDINVGWLGTSKEKVEKRDAHFLFSLSTIIYIVNSLIFDVFAVLRFVGINICG